MKKYNEQLFTTNWNRISPFLRGNWNRLSYEDIEQIEGSYDEFLRTMEQRYGYSQLQIQAELFEFLFLQLQIKRIGRYEQETA